MEATKASVEAVEAADAINGATVDWRAEVAASKLIEATANAHTKAGSSNGSMAKATTAVSKLSLRLAGHHGHCADGCE